VRRLFSAAVRRLFSAAVRRLFSAAVRRLFSAAVRRLFSAAVRRLFSGLLGLGAVPACPRGPARSWPRPVGPVQSGLVGVFDVGVEALAPLPAVGSAHDACW
jgi:hypothetical protein